MFQPSPCRAKDPRRCTPKDCSGPFAMLACSNQRAKSQRRCRAPFSNPLLIVATSGCHPQSKNRPLARMVWIPGSLAHSSLEPADCDNEQLLSPIQEQASGTDGLDSRLASSLVSGTCETDPESAPMAAESAEASEASIAGLSGTLSSARRCWPCHGWT